MKTKAKAAKAATVRVHAHAFIGALKFASYAMSQEETRYYLCGVHVELGDDGMRFCATDGHRMHVQTLKCAKSLGPGRLLITTKDVKALLKAYKPAKQFDLVSLNFATGVVSFGEITTTYAAHTGIDLRRHMPNNPKPAFTFEMQELRPYLDGACAAADPGTVSRIDATSEKLEFSSRILCTSRRSYTKVSVELDGNVKPYVSKSISVGFNAVYLRDMVKAFHLYGLLQCATDDCSYPSLWTKPGDEFNRCVVLMPMRN